VHTCIDKRQNTILFSGYCSPHTLGGQLLGHVKVVDSQGEKKEVRAEIAQLQGLSAHGDVDDICHFMNCQDPAMVRGIFLVHGEPEAQEMLASRLSAKGFYPVQAPEMHAGVRLNVGAGEVKVA
jgi:metallo-beta-lactamase family protein